MLETVLISVVVAIIGCLVITSVQRLTSPTAARKRQIARIAKSERAADNLRAGES